MVNIIDMRIVVNGVIRNSAQPTFNAMPNFQVISQTVGKVLKTKQNAW